MPKKLTDAEVLALPMGTNDANADTIGEYLKALLAKLWVDRERFSGKRPFGNGGWDFDLLEPLIKAHAIRGKLDEDGFIQECDEEAGYTIIADAIDSLL